MSQKRASTEISFAVSATLAAYVLVKPTGTRNQVGLWDTATALFAGISQEASSGGTGTAVLVAIGGSAKGQAGASVSSGALLTGQTATGYVIEASANTLNTTTTAIPRTIGWSNHAASTNGILEVFIAINNVRIAVS